MKGRAAPIVVVLCASALAAGCGSSSKPAAAPTPTATATTAKTATTPPPTSPSALQAEANSVATGDIPDNQVFLTFNDAAAGWSMKYPEGWAQSSSGSTLAFRDKNNIVRVLVSKGGTPAASRIRRQLKGVHVESGPQALTISGAPAFKIVYSTESAPSSVTGKRVTLVVDRYYLSHGAKEAIVDLGTPKGVDNVDAYRLMVESFKWK